MWRSQKLTDSFFGKSSRLITSNHKIHEKISYLVSNRIFKIIMIAKNGRSSVKSVFKKFTDNMKTYRVAMCNKCVSTTKQST